MVNKIKDDPKLYAIYKEKVLTCKNQHDTDNLLVWITKQFEPKKSKTKIINSKL